MPVITYKRTEIQEDDSDFFLNLVISILCSKRCGVLVPCKDSDPYTIRIVWRKSDFLFLEQSVLKEF